MNTYNLYIGANNETKQVEQEKLEYLLDGFTDGYTVIKSTGVWKGEHEDSVIVTIMSEPEHLETLLKVLKMDLKQEAIAYQQVNELKFF